MLILFITLLVISSCDNTENKANILPPDIQYTADTMFAHKRNQIIDEIDSICAVGFDEMVAMKVDSFLALEEERREAILGR